MTNEAPETALQKTVVALLRWSARRGVIWNSVPNEGKRTPAEAERLKAIGMLPGAADLHICIDGRCHWLELKSEKGRQTEEQKAFELRCEMAGAPYALARSFEEARAILISWGAFRETEQRRVAA